MVVCIVRSIALLCLLALAFTVSVRAESEFVVPEALLEWRDKTYSQRYFLKVETQGEAGNVNLHAEAPAASIILPLRLLPGPGEKSKPESILLVGEDGFVHPILVRAAPGEREVEVAFATRSGLRRFCLYAGAPDGLCQNASPTHFTTEALRVNIRGRSIPGDLIYTPERPLTLERFQQIEERPDGVLGQRYAAHVNDPECPFFKITANQSGRRQELQNPRHYGALYEGFLRAPVKGIYKFSIDTLGAAQLVIDGRAVLGAEGPDPSRAPFALNGELELTEGLHRVVVHYAEANTTPGKSNADLSRFGVRLHWQPPFAQSMMCVPAQAFPRALPAVVLRYEGAEGNPQPFVHLERLGQVRVGAHLGQSRAQEYVLLMAKVSGVAAPSLLQLGEQLLDSGSCAWVRAGALSVRVLSPESRQALFTREALFPTSEQGARDVLDLEAELAVKAAPEVLYPDETGQIHLETLLAAAPTIVPKERMDERLLPPQPRALGQFRVVSQLVGPNQAGESVSKDATPIAGTRQKVRIPVSAPEIEGQSRDGQSRLVLRLLVGEVEVQRCVFRLLHSKEKNWPGVLIAAAGTLLFGDKPLEPRSASPSPDDPLKATAASLERTDLDRALIMVPRENESDYRFAAPLKATLQPAPGKTALFIGDPLVENVSEGGGPIGLAARLAQATTYQWQCIAVQGPHRYLPIFRVLAELEVFLRKTGSPPTQAVVCLGAGDVARQTPLHVFERALDLMIDRLRVHGVNKIVIVGVLPEPTRDKQCEPYQQHLADVLRQHHLEGVDLFSLWLKEDDWARRYTLNPEQSSPIYGPTPNSSALDELSELIKKRL